MRTDPSRPSSKPARVLIVGAGPVGLALAIELGHRSIPCRVVERNERVGLAPRAKTTNVRTREHLRRWGIAERLRAASPLGLDYPSNVVFCTRLAGHALTRFENAFCCAPGRHPMYSEHAQWIPQYLLEEVLREHAESLPGVELQFNCAFESAAQDSGGVQVRLRDLVRGDDIALRADYLVGADGARSAVRDTLGARMQGQQGLSRNFNIVFRAPGLAQAHRHGSAIMYWQVNRDTPSLIGPMDRDDRWFFMPTQLPPELQRAGLDSAALIARATGIQLPYEVLSTDEWVASRLIADRYRERRIFIAGDACHVHPPFGGHGMNMGIGDSVDLGWKLAAVLQGWGGEGLLDSYESERRQVHERVLDEAVANHAMLGHQLAADGIEDDGEAADGLRAQVGARIQSAKLREFCTLGVVLGDRYEDSPVVVADGSPAPASDFINHVPSSRPGSLAPHGWLHDGSSLYDHFGAGFTLLTSPAAGASSLARVAADAATLGVPLKFVQPSEAGVLAHYPAAFTLIRPDQHVAWRGPDWPADSTHLFRLVTGQVQQAQAR